MICIYAIKNTINGKVYIGSTNNMTRRFKKHKSELKRNCHCNTYLQRAWNKYGEDCLDFIILTTCSEKQLIKKEIYYINKFHSLNPTYGYNLILPKQPSTRNISDSLRKKLSDKKKGITPVNFEEMQKRRWKSLNVYKHAKFYKNYESVRQVEIDLKIPRGNIYNYLKGKTKGIKGFMEYHFEFKEEKI